MPPQILHQFAILLVAIRTTQISTSPLNQHTQYIDSNGDHIWKSTSDFVPVQSSSFGNITIGHIMSMEFDFVWNGHTNTSPEFEFEGSMFFRIGADAVKGGGSCYGNYNRYPALFITNDHSPSLVLFLSEEGDCSKSYDLSPFGAIEQSVVYHILISFNMTILYVSIAEQGLIPRSTAWTRSGTPSQFIGAVVPVWWMSNKFGSNDSMHSNDSSDYVPADGVFSNITITSKVVNPEEAVIPIPESDTLQSIESSKWTKTADDWSIIIFLALLIGLCVMVALSVVCSCIYFQRQSSKEMESEMAVIGETTERLKTNDDLHKEPNRNEAVDIVMSARSLSTANEAMYLNTENHLQQTKGPGFSESSSYPSLPPTPMTALTGDSTTPKPNRSQDLEATRTRKVPYGWVEGEGKVLIYGLENHLNVTRMLAFQYFYGFYLILLYQYLIFDSLSSIRLSINITFDRIIWN